MILGGIEFVAIAGGAGVVANVGNSLLQGWLRKLGRLGALSSRAESANNFNMENIDALIDAAGAQLVADEMVEGADELYTVADPNVEDPEPAETPGERRVNRSARQNARAHRRAHRRRRTLAQDAAANNSSQLSHLTAEVCLAVRARVGPLVDRPSNRMVAGRAARDICREMGYSSALTCAICPAVAESLFTPTIQELGVQQESASEANRARRQRAAGERTWYERFLGARFGGAQPERTW